MPAAVAPGTPDRGRHAALAAVAITEACTVRSERELDVAAPFAAATLAAAAAKPTAAVTAVAAPTATFAAVALAAAALATTLAQPSASAVALAAVAVRGQESA